MCDVIQTAEDVLPGFFGFQSRLFLVLLCGLRKQKVNKKHYFFDTYLAHQSKVWTQLLVHFFFFNLYNFLHCRQTLKTSNI